MTKMTDAWKLDNLPSEVLILIFNLCHAFDLVRLSEVCSRFHSIIKHDSLWITKSKQVLVTNETSKRFSERCCRSLPLRDKWHVSQNWRDGKFWENFCRFQRAKLMPFLHLTKDELWWGGGNEIIAYRRQGGLNTCAIAFYASQLSDVSRFIVRDGIVICGNRDGSISGFNQENSAALFYALNVHSSDVNAIAMPNAEVIISGSRDKTVKIWPFSSGFGTAPLVAIELQDRIWSLANDPTGQIFVVGSAGNNGVPPFHIYDTNRGTEIDILRHTWQRGAGVLDIVWENPQTFLTCGYDTYIRKWDIRTGTCVGAWADPTDATVYCISSDYQYTIVSGTQFNCKVVLWDQRQSDYVQMYFLGNRACSSPVYSVCFDSSYLYGGTDQCLVELAFSGYSYREKNYRNVLRY